MSSNIQWSELDNYVYAYVDPRDDSVFYVGKGKGKRALAHLSDTKESKKVRYISQLKALGLEPRIELIRFGIGTSEEAEIIEASCIDVIGIENLTNEVRGKGSRHVGRKTLEEVSALISSEDVEIVDPVVLILINKTFHYGMDDLHLYEITRGIWNRFPKNYQSAKYALAIYEGVVQEVYEIAGWFSAHSTQYFVREFSGEESDRMEFVGKIANEEIRRKYKNKTITNTVGRSYGWSTKWLNLSPVS
ncbi:MAG: hypothetical protein KIG85_04980 [Thiopseudomonas sp.]|nr:hypothetical protein [Thiopseudomonas sp.]